MEKELKDKHILENVCGNDFISGSKIYFNRNSRYYLKEKEFGKTFYLVYHGVLRQFRFKKTIVYPFTYGIRKRDSLGIYGNVTILDVAGIGELNVGCSMYGGELDFPIYESIEDYKNGKVYKPEYYRTDKEVCEKWYGVSLICDDYIMNSDYTLYRWHWNGTCAELERVYDLIPICFIRDADGVHFPDGWSKNNLSGWTTKEECEKDNEISVCCFAGNEPEPEEKEKTIRLSVEIKESDIPRLKEFVKIID